MLVSSIRTSVTALAFWVFMYSVRGGLEWAFHSSPLRRIALLRSNADAVIRQVSFLFDVVVGVYLLSVTLMISEVHDSIAVTLEKTS